MDLHAIHPKQAVKEFLQKYFARDIFEDDCYYVTEDSMGAVVNNRSQGEEGKCPFRAKLHVPILDQIRGGGVFQGEWRDSPIEAQVSAAEQFVAHEFVREVAPELPAPKNVIKHSIRKSDTTSTNEQISERVDRAYNEQRNQGRRMAVWDGIA